MVGINVKVWFNVEVYCKIKVFMLASTKIIIHGPSLDTVTNSYVKWEKSQIKIIKYYNFEFAK